MSSHTQPPDRELPGAFRLQRLTLGTIALVLLAILLGMPDHLQAQFPPSTETVMEIGVVDGPEEETFGLITDVSVGPQGRIFIVDRFGSEIRWFHSDGTYGGTVGRAGEGPGEFRSPAAVAFDDGGRLHVLDQGNLRITTYDPDDVGYSYGFDTRTPSPATDICAVGDRRFVLTPYEEFTVLVVGPDGGVVGQFGEALEADPDTRNRLGPQVSRVLRPRLNQGRLLCDPASGTVVIATEATPVIRAFTVQGDLLWQTELERYRMVRFSAVRGQCCAYGLNEVSNSFHSGEGLVLGEEGVVWVSLAELPGGSIAEAKYEVRAISLSDGTEVGRAEIPFPFTDARHGTFVGFVRDPFPKVLVTDLAGSVGRAGTGATRRRVPAATVPALPTAPIEQVTVGELAVRMDPQEAEIGWKMASDPDVVSVDNRYSIFGLVGLQEGVAKKVAEHPI